MGNIISRWLFYRHPFNRRVRTIHRAYDDLRGVGYAIGCLDLRQNPVIYGTIDEIPSREGLDNIQQVIYLPNAPEVTSAS